MPPAIYDSRFESCPILCVWLFHTFERVLKMRFVCAFLMLVGSAFGQTYYSSLNVLTGVTKTLTKAGSPHVFTGQINVYGTLVVEAGVEIVFPKAARINLWRGDQTQLWINGTGLEPVLIRSTGGQWGGISVVSSSTKAVVRIANCVFDNVGSSTSSLDLRNSDVIMQSSMLNVVQPVGSTTAITAISCGTSVGLISDCEIRGGAIGIRLGSSQVIVDQVDVFGATNPIDATNRNIRISVQGQ